MNESSKSITGEATPETPAVSSKWVTYAIEGAILMLALILGLLIRAGVYETVLIPSASMEPTLKIGDRMLVDHRNSLHGRWRRGDIITFHPPESWQDPDQDLLVKRIIGLPGETVDIYQGKVYINGKELQENYLQAPMDPDDPIQLSLVPGQYFVMGDNRNNSDDSRDHGPVPEQDIRGRAVRLLAPFSRMGALPPPNYP